MVEMVTELERSCLAILPTHLLGRLASMRDTQDSGIGITATNVQGFGGQRLSLARARPRDHDRWTVDRP